MGGGPVGMTLALLLARGGRPSVIVEEKTQRPTTSRAIGITSPSLDVFRRIGLADRARAAGVEIREVGRLRFDGLPGPYPFILSLSQAKTEALLLDRIREVSGIRVVAGTTARGVRVEGDRVVVPTDGVRKDSSTFTGACLCGCDGADSVVREVCGGVRMRRTYSPTFLMGDFSGDHGLGAAAHLFFTPVFLAGDAAHTIPPIGARPSACRSEPFAVRCSRRHETPSSRCY